MMHTIRIDEKTGINYIDVTVGSAKVTFVNFGARIQEWNMPDKDGKISNIILSLDTPQDILNDSAQFGALVGPVAGRIKNAKWNDLELEKNNGNHHLHGGNNGWWNQFWNFSIEEKEDSICVIFTLTDTLSGYPGPINVTNTYEVTKDAIHMTTSCTSESNTLANPTNHIYFNLSGDAVSDITDHTLYIAADKYVEVDSETIPSGNLLDVAGTELDFREPVKLNKVLKNLKGGIDDAFLLSESQPQVILSHELSGRQVTIESDRQAVVVFSTTGFEPELNVNNQTMKSELGIAIETQELPDMINHPEWGSIDLPKNTTKTWHTSYIYNLT